jgi:hypothetical protein
VPELPSARLAKDLSRDYDRPINAANVRQMLHRARVRFSELLRVEVAESIPTTDPAEVDAELAELGLFIYCSTPRSDAG